MEGRRREGERERGREGERERGRETNYSWVYYLYVVEIRTKQNTFFGCFDRKNVTITPSRKHPCTVHCYGHHHQNNMYIHVHALYVYRVHA